MKYLDTIKKICKYHQIFIPIIERLERERSALISKCPLSIKSYLALQLFQSNYSPVLTCENFVTARQVKSEIELLGFSDSSILFTFEQEDIHSLSIEEFLSVVQKKNYIIITTTKSLEQKVISKDNFSKNQIEITLKFKCKL